MLLKHLQAHKKPLSIRGVYWRGLTKYCVQPRKSRHLKKASRILLRMGMAMANPDQDRGASSAAGLAGGTSLSGLILLMPDGIMRYILLLLAPTITILITRSWHIVEQEASSLVADWQIRRLKKNLTKVYDCMKTKESTNPEEMARLKQGLNSLTKWQVDITEKRVRAIMVEGASPLDLMREQVDGGQPGRHRVARKGRAQQVRTKSDPV